MERDEIVVVMDGRPERIGIQVADRKVEIEDGVVDVEFAERIDAQVNGAFQKPARFEESEGKSADRAIQVEPRDQGLNGARRQEIRGDQLSKVKGIGKKK